MSYSKAAERFFQDFENYGDRIALIWHDQEFSYSYLLERVEHWQQQLTDIPFGSIVGLESDFSPETIAIMFVLIHRNTTLATFDISHKDKNEAKMKIAQLDYLICVSSETDIQIHKKVKSEPLHDIYQTLVTKEVPGLVLFTSGSSGQPKGAVHDFSRLLEKFKVKRKSLRTINFLLFDHWGGLNTLFHILSNGGTVLMLEKRNPDYVCSLIERYNVELLPTSPTFLNMLALSRAYERHNLDSLKIISYGSEPMPTSLLVRLSKLFPHIKLQQTYGLIELGVMRSKSESNDSLWVKLGGEGYATRVVEGTLQIKSESAMIGYLNAESPFTDDGWFMTGDAVEVKGEYFKILGRKSEIINVGGEKVFPQEVENVVIQYPDVEDVYVYGEDNRLTGKIVCAKVNYKGDAVKPEFIKGLKTFCRDKLQSFKVPVKIKIVDTSFESDQFKKVRAGG